MKGTRGCGTEEVRPSKAIALVPKLEHASELTRMLVKTQIDRSPPPPVSVGLGRNWRICISNCFPNDAV